MRDCPEGSSPRGRAEELWDGALSEMLKYHEQLEEAGLHKQITNRILEPWMWVTSIISATDWENFFFLRVHPDAQNEFQTLARAIRDAMEESTPRVLPAGGWHLPLFTDEDWEDTKALAVAKDHPPFSPLEIAKRVSVGRCARVSYLTHEGKRDLREDLKLADKLLSGWKSGNPIHASPAESVAMALDYETVPVLVPEPLGPVDLTLRLDGQYEDRAGKVYQIVFERRVPRWGNFSGFRQFRKFLPGEHAGREIRR